jgi:hypothetical protein
MWNPGKRYRGATLRRAVSASRPRESPKAHPPRARDRVQVLELPRQAPDFLLGPLSLFTGAAALIFEHQDPIAVCHCTRHP